MGPEKDIHDAGQKLYTELTSFGFETLWDDRDARPGVKFNDADLIGLPLQLIIGKKSLEKNEVEFKIRRNSEKGSFAQKDLEKELGKLFSKII